MEKYIKYKNKYLKKKGGSSRIVGINQFDILEEFQQTIDLEKQLILSNDQRIIHPRIKNYNARQKYIKAYIFDTNDNTIYLNSNHFKDYFFSFHGERDDRRYKLPFNVRVIMLRQPNAEFTASADNEFLLWLSTFKKFGQKLEYLDFIYTNAKAKYEHSKFRELSVFSGACKKHNTIDDLILTYEGVQFRTGIYKLPIQFQRIYINNHFSITKNEMIKVGTIENINNNEIIDNAIENNFEFNNLQNKLKTYNRLIIEAYPTIINQDIKKKPYYEDSMWVQHIYPLIYDGINVLYQSFRLNSIVTPKEECVVLKQRTPEEIQNKQIKLEFRLSELIEDIVNIPENKNKMITILVSACRNNIPGYVSDNDYLYHGIPLPDYVNHLNFLNGAKYTAYKNIFDFNQAILDPLILDLRDIQVNYDEY